MKKAKIIIGAFIMLSLFGANAFAQKQNSSALDAMFAVFPSTWTKAINETKQEQEKNGPTGFIVKMNPQNVYLGENLISNSSAETFKVILPLGLEKSELPAYTTWTSKETTFFTEIQFPYMYITVKANNMENINTVSLKVRAIADEGAKAVEKGQKIYPQISFENSNAVLRLDYKIGDKEFTKYFGQYKPVAYIRALNNYFSKKPLGEYFKLSDRNHVSVVLPGNYELVTSYWHTREYFGFETKIVPSNEVKSNLLSIYKEENISSDGKSLLLAFNNSNPVLEKVSVKITEENGKIYLSYISGDIFDKKVHKQLIAIKK